MKLIANNRRHFRGRNLQVLHARWPSRSNATGAISWGLSGSDRRPLAALLPTPIDQVAATPYQRDFSRAHVKRLQEVMRKIDRFVDPIVAISPQPGQYWTPNGHHRLAALQHLKCTVIPAILIPEETVAYQIL